MEPESVMNAPILCDLTIEEIVCHCRQEIRQYRERGTVMNPYTALLFQRAIQEGDQVAWTSIWELYSPLVRVWVERFLSGSWRDCQEVESLMNAAFAQFAGAFNAEKLAQSESVAAILRYLKLCTRTIVSNEVRRHKAQRREVSLDVMGLIEYVGMGLDDSASEVIESVSAQELWRVILEELRDENERLLLYLTCICGMKPGEISSEYRQYFPVVGDVYRLKQSIRARLLVSRRIQAFLAPARSDAPAPEETCEEHGRLIAAQPVSLPLSMQAESAQAVPQRTGQGEMGNTVKYYQQRAFCGKPRCRQCREGKGHGPYWYAYHSEHGKTIQTYVGRELPMSPVQPFAQRRPENEVKYHLQKTFCGKPKCKRCREGAGHGPYWFAYQTVHGQTKRTYVGKSLPAGITNDRAGESLPVIRVHQDNQGACL